MPSLCDKTIDVPQGDTRISHNTRNPLENAAAEDLRGRFYVSATAVIFGRLKAWNVEQPMRDRTEPVYSGLISGSLEESLPTGTFIAYRAFGVRYSKPATFVVMVGVCYFSIPLWSRA